MEGLGAALERTGITLAIWGAACLTGIFLVVIHNGSWPGFLEPIRQLFATNACVSGEFTLIVELILFIGPGILIRVAGERIRDST